MDEEEALIKFLREGRSLPPFDDELHRRLANALLDPSASSLDRAVLMRQLMRRLSLRDGRKVPVELADVFVESIRKESVRVGLRERTNGMWTAEAWEPEWIDLNGGVPDAAASAGSAMGKRLHGDRLSADPFFEEATEFDSYQTPGQRAACRAIMTTPQASTVIAMLPTGSGKTEAALCLSERSRYGVTIIVVPTIALAYDFERRFREHFARKNRLNPRFNPNAIPIAWTASTNEATRAAISQRISQGQQRLLVTSPESMTRALRQTLLEAASKGRLQGFVIDEAHLVTQWGRFFRPEFRTLADFRHDLLLRAQENGYAQAITLLLSATLGAAEMEDLISLFGVPGPCSPVVANALRSEPDIWIAHASDTEERAMRVLDTLAHCARPAVLYVTSPDEAERWYIELRATGYSRIASVTGKTRTADRAAVLDGLRTNSGSNNPIDLVVATSAFGLGIDYPHIRSIVHACLPETVDRWYQELGRGGRDGDACAAFLLTAPGDEREAASLGVKVLSPAFAQERWLDIWDHKKRLNGKTFVDLEGARGSVGKGDYNRRWNAQVIQGLIELGELRREQFDVEDLRELLNTDDVEVSDWTAVSRAAARMGSPSFWDEIWLHWQRSEMSGSSQSLKRINDVSDLRVAACHGIAQAYAPSVQLRETWGSRLQYMEPIASCGRCPDCRQRGVPVYADPPPSPEQVWAIAPSEVTELAKFVTAARGVNGVVFLTYKSDEGAIYSRIAYGLAMLGVRHFGGLPAPVSRPGDINFFDERPLAPVDLAPVPSFSYFAPGQPVPPRWLVRRAAPRTANNGQHVADILLVPVGTAIGMRLVGRDIPSLASVTAAELLPRS